MPKRMSRETFDRIVVLLASGLKHIEISRIISVDGCTVAKVDQGKHFYQQTAEEQERRENRGDRERNPSPEEIAAACKEIQATWSEERLAGRRYVSVGDDPNGWTPPEFSTLELSRA